MSDDRAAHIRRLKNQIELHANHDTGKADEIYRVPSSIYSDPERWRREVDEVFLRVPLALGLAAEIPNVNDYKALSPAGVPVVMYRGEDGSARAFYNSCKHRGTMIADVGLGHGNHIACPYHGWCFDAEGSLTVLPEARTFGQVDRSQLGLTQLPCEERYGIVWVILTPHIEMDLDEWIGEASSAIADLHLESLYFFASTELKGPNWKLAMDGYIETYHFAALHPNTFSRDMYSNLAEFEGLGRHKRLWVCRRGLEQLDGIPEEEWALDNWLGQALNIFPNVQISYAFLNDADEPLYGRHCLVVMIYPGAGVGESVTYLSHLSTKPADTDAARKGLTEIAEYLHTYVAAEDYWAGGRIQQTFPQAAPEELLFGRNEPGLGHHHHNLDLLLGER
jgi:nitrite reductase/ring-hydroxylating ferredoxin subunit